MCYFFNVLESGFTNGLDEEPCDEFLTCGLEQINQIRGCILTPPLAPTREPAGSPGEMYCRCHKCSTFSKGLSAQVSSMVKARIKLSHSFMELVSNAVA